MSKKGVAKAADAAASKQQSLREVALRRASGSSKRSFFDIVVGLRDRGVGQTFKRARDRGEDTSFAPVAVETYFTKTGIARGKAVGVYTFRGVKEDVIRPLKSGCKKEWKLVTDRQ